MIKKQIPSIIIAMLSVVLSACVTQEFTNDEMPVVKNQANRDDMAATRISLGLGYMKMGNMAQAKQNLEKAKKFSPSMVQVYTAFAHYYETVGENELTISSFEEALSLQSDDADTLNNYGVYLCRQNQIKAAEKQFLKAIAVPSYILVAKSYENLATCFLQKDNFVKAEMYLHKAVMHSPGNSSILFQMVRLQYALGKYTEAKIFQQRFEKVTRRFTPQSLALAYKVFRKIGQQHIAKNYGAMLVKMYPQSWETQQFLLNELELIEADSLATRYQSAQMSYTVTKSKKRVVKLSPKKILSNTHSPNNTKSSASIVEPNIVNQKGIQLSTESVIFDPGQSQDKESKLPSNKSDQDKRVIVLVAPKKIESNVKKAPEAVNKGKDEEALISNVTDKPQSTTVSNPPVNIHVVTKGDSLYGISLKYNIKMKALRRWNNLTDNKKVKINDKLHLIDPNTVIE